LQAMRDANFKTVVDCGIMDPGSLSLIVNYAKSGLLSIHSHSHIVLLCVIFAAF